MERYLKDEPKQHHGSKKMSSDLDSPWDMFAPPGGPLSGAWKVEMIDDKLNLDHDSLSTTSSSSSCSHLSWDAPLSCAVVVKKEQIDEDYDDNSDGYDDSFTSSSSSSIGSNINNNNNNINNNNNKLYHHHSSSSSSHKLRNIESHHHSHNHNHHNHHHHLHRQNAAIELTIIDRSNLPTLTPPSSPEPNLQQKSSTNTSAISNNNNNNNHHLSIRQANIGSLIGSHNVGGDSASNNNNHSIKERKNVLRITQGTTLPRNAIVGLATGRNSIGVARLIHVSSKYQNALPDKTIVGSTTGKSSIVLYSFSC